MIINNYIAKWDRELLVPTNIFERDLSVSMEECDALCTRIAIMVNGQFKCLGSPQHLKSKFGQGYTLVVKMANHDGGTIAPAQPVVDFIMDKFPGSQKFDDHQGYIHFQVHRVLVPY